MQALIIAAELVNPPTELSAFRTFTVYAKMSLFGRGPQHITLIEVERAYQDIYYKYMKDHGLFDCIDDMVYPEWKEIGTRIKPPIVNRINLTNINFLLTLL